MSAEREAVATLVQGGHAHLGVERAVANLGADNRGRRPEALPYAVWELLEHMRIAQEDILRYTLDPAWSSPPWPDGYWPEPRHSVDDATWSTTLDGFLADRNELVELVLDPATDLGAELPHGGGRTYLRQALVAADHNAYHTGQIVAVRRALGAWPPGDG